MYVDLLSHHPRRGHLAHRAWTAVLLSRWRRNRTALLPVMALLVVALAMVGFDTEKNPAFRAGLAVRSGQHVRPRRRRQLQRQCLPAGRPVPRAVRAQLRLRGCRDRRLRRAVQPLCGPPLARPCRGRRPGRRRLPAGPGLCLRRLAGGRDRAGRQQRLPGRLSRARDSGYWSATPPTLASCVRAPSTRLRCSWPSAAGTR